MAVSVINAATVPGPLPEVIENSSEHNDIGEYSFTTRLSDGTLRHEEAKVVNPGQETQYLRVAGYFEFQTPDGQTYHTDYKSDVKGFRPRGAHIPPWPKAPKNKQN